MLYLVVELHRASLNFYIQFDNFSDTSSIVSSSRIKTTSCVPAGRTASLSLCPTLIRRPSIGPDESVSLTSIRREMNNVSVGVPTSAATSSPAKYATVPRINSTQPYRVGSANTPDFGAMSQSCHAGALPASMSTSQTSTPSGSPSAVRRIMGTIRPGAIDNSALMTPNMSRVGNWMESNYL